MTLTDTAAPDGPVAESPLEPDPSAGSGTRKRLDHVDAMRPIKQVGVVSSHTLIAFAPVGTGVAVGASLQLLHVTREAFLFISACMLAYSCRGMVITNLRSFYQRRFALVGVPYLCWTVIYFFLTYNSTSGSVGVKLTHLAYLMGTGYYQLYYLVVLMQFYVVFPLLLMLLRRTQGHHGALLAVSGVLQLVYVSLMHWGVVPSQFQGFWASREIISYQFYLVAGMVVAAHFDVVHQLIVSHVRLIVFSTFAGAGVAELWFFLAQDKVVHWLGPSSDPFQPVVIPFNVGAIACIYLVGVALVDHRRSHHLRVAVLSGSDNSYGVYLAQLLFITVLGWLGWRHLNSVVPWPLVSILTVALVFLACVALTAVLARTPMARPLSGRTRVPWNLRQSTPAPSPTAGSAAPPSRPLETVGSD